MKTWTTPQLIVLVRNDPQETVLTTCKDGNPVMMAQAIEPSAYYSSCMQSTEPTNTPAACAGCSSVSAS